MSMSAMDVNDIKIRLGLAEYNVLTLLAAIHKIMEIESRSDPTFSIRHAETMLAVNTIYEREERRIREIEKSPEKTLKKAQESLNIGGNGPSFAPGT